MGLGLWDLRAGGEGLGACMGKFKLMGYVARWAGFTLVRDLEFRGNRLGNWGRLLYGIRV